MPYGEGWGTAGEQRRVQAACHTQFALITLHCSSAFNPNPKTCNECAANIPRMTIVSLFGLRIRLNRVWDIPRSVQHNCVCYRVKSKSADGLIFKADPYSAMIGCLRSCPLTPVASSTVWLTSLLL